MRFLILALLLSHSMIFAQKVQRDIKATPGLDEGQFVIAPGPSYMPSTKLGLDLIGMYLFDANKGKYKNSAKPVPPSILGAFGKITTNGTAMGAIGTKLHLGEDKWRITGGYLEGNILSQMFQAELERFLDTSNKIRAVIINVNRRVWKDLFIGGGIIWNEVIFKADTNPESYATNTGLKLNLFYDTRDNTFSPTSGFYLNTRTNFYRENLGGDDNITTLEATLSHYISLGGNTNHLFSWLFDSSFNLGDTNPNYNYNYGSRGPRGYTGKVYEGANMVRFEGEYKHYFESIMDGKFGIAGFAGVGFAFGGESRVGNDIPSDLFEADPLSHIGTGIRYKILPKQNLNSRVDIAYGREKEFTMYFALNEAI